LIRAGFEIAVCENGRHALESALSDPPTLMILDVMLPEMDGFEILTRLRADPRTQSLPILMLTAKGQREDREHALAKGANRFVSKPFSNAELIETVQLLAQSSGQPADQQAENRNAEATGSTA
jgi:DNA-binding response OmpR family regulator